MSNTIQDNSARGRFELDIDGHVAFMNYRSSPGVITLTHTEVPPELGGKGVGTRLARAVLDIARQRGLKLVVQCDFVQAYLSKHPEFNDLLRSPAQIFVDP